MLQLQKLQAADDMLQIRDEARGYFSGYASKFNGVDAVGDTILPGAYDQIIESGVMPKMFWNHRMYDLPLGKYMSMKVDDVGLMVEGELTKGNRLSESVRASMKHGTVDGLSVQIWLMEGDFEISPDGQNRKIKNVTRMPEISVCTMPCDDGARIDLSSVKSALDRCTSYAELEDLLRDAAGFSRSSAKAFLARVKDVALREADAADGSEGLTLSLGAIPQSLFKE